MTEWMKSLLSHLFLAVQIPIHINHSDFIFVIEFLDVLLKHSGGLGVTDEEYMGS